MALKTREQRQVVKQDDQQNSIITMYIANLGNVFQKTFSISAFNFIAQMAPRLTTRNRPGSDCIYRHPIERVAIVTIVLKTERNPRIAYRTSRALSGRRGQYTTINQNRSVIVSQDTTARSARVRLELLIESIMYNAYEKLSIFRGSAKVDPRILRLTITVCSKQFVRNNTFARERLLLHYVFSIFFFFFRIVRSCLVTHCVNAWGCLGELVIDRVSHFIGKRKTRNLKVKLSFKR